MNHADHVYLLEGEPGLRAQLKLPIRGAGGTWADLGAGWGAFTLALADLLGPQAHIYAVDRDRQALQDLEFALRSRFPQTQLELQNTDFTRPLDLPLLDGIVMANALHFIADAQKPALLRRFAALLKPGGQLILVEYDVDRGNIWVPHPLSFTTWRKLAPTAGYTQPSRLGRVPSRFLQAIYSAVCQPIPDR